MSQARRSRPPQRWPDVMIGVLTLALMGGFGALMLRPHTASTPIAVAPQPSSSAIPASPGTVPEPAVIPEKAAPETSTPAASTPETATPKTASEATTAATPETPPTATATTPTTTTPTTPTPATTTPADTATTGTATTGAATDSAALAQTSEIPPAPKAPPVKPIEPPVLPKPKPVEARPAQTEPAQASTKTDAAKTDTAKTETKSDTAAKPAAPATTAVARRAGGAVAVSENRTPLRSDYRITLGSFGNRSSAEGQTANVAALGYTVHPIDLGNQYVAQVGPFADEATARQALADIQRAYPGALLYRPKAKASEEASSTTASNETSSTSTRSASSSSTSSSTADSSDSTPADTGPTYLQVGAFDRVESAQKLVGILEDNGFAPTVNNPPDRKTTVMVGPYSGGALRRAKARLERAGLDYFPVH